MSTDEANPSTSESSPLEPSAPQPQPQYQEVELEVESASSAADRAMAEVALSFTREISRFVEISDPLDPSSFITSSRNPRRSQRVQVHLAVASPMPGSFLFDHQMEEQRLQQERREPTPVVPSADELPSAEEGEEREGSPEVDSDQNESQSQRSSPADHEGDDDEEEDEDEDEEEDEEDEEEDDQTRAVDQFQRNFRSTRGQNEFRLMEALGVGPFGGYPPLPSSNAHRKKENTLFPDPSHLTWQEKMKLFDDTEVQYDLSTSLLERLKTNAHTLEVGDNKMKLCYVNEKVVKELMEARAEIDLETRDLLEHLKPQEEERIEIDLEMEEEARAELDLETSDLVEHLKTHDIKEGIYEGGFKVWEGALDLANFLLSSECNFDFEGKDVFEIGCGAGLLGILACKKKCGRVVVQDYNESVLECFTKTNFFANDISADLVEFIHGDWRDLTRIMKPRQYDLIVSTGTICNVGSYEKLHDLMFRTLKDNGYIYLAARVENFEVAGCTTGFLDFIRREGRFSAEVKWTSRSTVPCYIVELRKTPIHKLTTAKPSLKKNRTPRTRGKASKKAKEVIESTGEANSK